MIQGNSSHSIDIFDFDDFDAQWYVTEYPDVLRLGMDPAEHYRWIGRKLGRKRNGQDKAGRPLGSEVTSRPASKAVARIPFDRFGIIQHNPLISVLIVSYNSGKDLERLLPTLNSQTYRNYEVVIVENGNEDTKSICEKYLSDFTYLTADNIGFAAANNLALENSSGEFIALVNPDTRLDDDLLQQLLQALRYDESAAIAAPKINFFEKFIRLSIKTDQKFSISRDSLTNGLEYKKIFVRVGSSLGETINSDETGELHLDLPYEGPRSINLQLRADTSLLRCAFQIGYATPVRLLPEGTREMNLRIDFTRQNCSTARYIVNNAGSGIQHDGGPYDRGFAEYDDGAYYSKIYLSAFCGCSALIRRIAIIDRALFTDSFFAYYEDSELSHWIIENGYRILYQPEAKIYHRHSESTEEASPLWNILVGRSRAIYDGMTSSDPKLLRGYSYPYPHDFSGPIRNTLEAFDRKITAAFGVDELHRPNRKTACIYNSYFSSMGGGEKHAIAIAEFLSKDYEVYLASETDFDIEDVSEYFSVDLRNVKKIISRNIDEHFTSKFDIFINSTFRSNLRGYAKQNNYYIVSFPHQEATQDVIRSYKFLHNSQLTQKWANNYWGSHDQEVILPIIGYNPQKIFISQKQEHRTILSVGRFIYDGHCKNHHKILDAFKKVMQRSPSLGDWRLKIIGSCDLQFEGSVKYLKDLIAQSGKYNVEICPNATHATLEQAYCHSSIYVHATGLGTPERAPELHEHFGIAPYEAMLYGCLPVVYAIGGPAEQIEGLSLARRFSDPESLARELEEAMWSIERGEVDPDEIALHARAMQTSNDSRLKALVQIEDVMR